jgi:hypothetical protein
MTIRDIFLNWANIKTTYSTIITSINAFEKMPNNKSKINNLIYIIRDKLY